MGLLLLGYIKKGQGPDLISQSTHDELCSGGEYRLGLGNNPTSVVLCLAQTLPGDVEHLDSSSPLSYSFLAPLLYGATIVARCCLDQPFVRVKTRGRSSTRRRHLLR
jgi:hypothetical protein